MATSIKLSELQSLTNLTPTDLFLVTDSETSSSRKVSYETLKSDTITGVQQTITDLIGDAPETLNQLSELADALQDNPNILSELQAAVASNDTDIANEVTARGVAVTGEQTAREQAVAALQALITSLQTEADARLSRIETLETSVDNLDIDIAPETLNSISELADAMGGDPQIITNLQTQLNDYIAHIEARNLEAGLATGVLYADTIYGG